MSRIIYFYCVSVLYFIVFLQKFDIVYCVSVCTIHIYSYFRIGSLLQCQIRCERGSRLWKGVEKKRLTEKRRKKERM